MTNIKRIDHVSLAVRDRAKALEFFTKALGARQVWSEGWPSQGFHWTLLELGDSCLLELIDPLGEASFLERFLEKRGDGAHHITLHVDDLGKTKRALDERGVPTFGYSEPYPGWKELYIHPKHAFGVLLQFAEFDPLHWVKPGDTVPAPYRQFLDKAKRELTGQLLPLGDARLRERCEPVADVASPALIEGAKRLRDVLTAVRTIFGFGRAIAAPQIGLAFRLIAFELEQGPRLMINPEITARSEKTFTCWDDCLSFPDLLVRVERHSSVTVGFLDAGGQKQEWTAPDRGTAELIQHEIDHLDGVLALDRAIDRESIISRQAYEGDSEHFDELVGLS